MIGVTDFFIGKLTPCVVNYIYRQYREETELLKAILNHLSHERNKIKILLRSRYLCAIIDLQMMYLAFTGTI